MRKLLVVFVTVFGLSLILWLPAHALDTKYPTKMSYYQTFFIKQKPLLVPKRADNTQQRVIPIAPKEEDKEAYKKKGE